MTKMKKIMVVFIILVFVFISYLYIGKDSDEVSNDNNYINIFELSDEFMDNYFNEMEKLNKEDKKENILIITSKENLDDYYGATKIVEGPNNQYFVQYKSEEDKNVALKKLKENTSISVDENIIYYPEEYNSWGVEAMGLDFGSNFVTTFQTKEDITVAIIDSGLDVNLFNSKYPGRLGGVYNALDPEETMSDVLGHGTHIAGTIAESTPSNVKIFPVKVGRDGGFSSTDIIQAFNYIVRNNLADVINLSFGSYFFNEAQYLAIESANEANMICVAAAGNDNVSSNHYPSGYDNTISVSAVDSSLNKAYFSNYGPSITFSAPGVSINSINGKKSGTSMATPHVVAATAILKSLNNNYTMNDAINIFKENAVDLGDPGWDKYYGYGFINFNEIPFCMENSVKCDINNVFEIKSYDDEITRFEIESANLTDYNFQNETNLMTFKIKFFYEYNSVEYSYIEYASDIDDLVIENYNPFSTEEQTITFNTHGLSVDYVLQQDENYVNNKAFLYEIYLEDEIEKAKLTTYYHQQNDLVELKKVIIPKVFDGYEVGILGENLFSSSLSKTTEVIIPNTVYKIENKAFYDTKVNIIKKEKDNENFKKIYVYDYAFAESKYLEILDAELVYIGNNAFENCNKLENISIFESESEKVLSIGSSAFKNCQNLVNINIPASITEIGESAFENTKIESITLPNKIKELKNNTFSGCMNLTNIIFNEGLEKIGDYVFKDNVNLTEISIPSTVKSITSLSFYSTPALDKFIVHDDNLIYDDRNNLLVETKNNKVIAGINSIQILPDSIESIGMYAFFNKAMLYALETNENLKTIEHGAFRNSKNFMAIIIKGGVTSIATNAFSYVSDDFYIVVFENDYARNYAKTNNIVYYSIDPSYVRVDLSKTSYKAFETVDTTNLEIYAEYDETIPTNEIITSGYTIKYKNDNNSFRYGDESFNISVENKYGYLISVDVFVEVEKKTPVYIVPTGLKSSTGKKLSDVALPSGFSWMNPDEEIVVAGNNTYKARFTPNDTINYEIVENIDIIVEVELTKKIVIPEFIIDSLEYSGQTSISSSKIRISNLDVSEYTIESAILNSVDIGDTTLEIKIKLTDDKFITHTFEGNVKEKTFNVPVTILAKKIVKPVAVLNTYIYTGEEQTFELTYFDSDIMIINNNKRTDAGKQDVVISLKDSNYVWEDGSNDNLTFIFQIDKAPLVVDYEISNKTFKYDGENHSLSLTINTQNINVKYMDSNDEYTLDNMPSYNESGSYLVKFKLYKDNNYTEIFDERTLIITNELCINNSTDYVGLYDGNEHTFNLDIVGDNYIIKYSINDYSYLLDDIPKFKDAGEYVINYKILKEGFEDVLGSNKVIIYGISEISSPAMLKGDTIIINSNKFTTLKNHIKVFALSKSFTYISKESEVLNDDLLKTGNKIKININGSKDYIYNVAVLGDLNGDGLINSGDLLKMRQHLLKIISLDKSYGLAADINKDSLINSGDLLKIKQHLLQINSILKD